ncbi:hypothetical protein [Serratia marcescens]|uniref:hypothetical protein n=1 Tax=Serratia marcescens TaxID=615 RepID=UPI003D6EA1F0
MKIRCMIDVLRSMLSLMKNKSEFCVLSQACSLRLDGEGNEKNEPYFVDFSFILTSRCGLFAKVIAWHSMKGKGIYAFNFKVYRLTKKSDYEKIRSI